VPSWLLRALSKVGWTNPDLISGERRRVETDPSIRICLLHPDAVVPTRAYFNDAGFDVASLIETEVTSDSISRVATGIEVEVPKGYYVRVAGRSSSTWRGLVVHESILDAEWQGELFVCAHAVGDPIRVCAGERIAQLILVPVAPAIIDLRVRSAPPMNGRGRNGVGSSGRQGLPQPASR
jgi:dUTP pyrophosphatase